MKDIIEELILQFDTIECEKEIEKIKINEEGFFFINKNSIYKNTNKIIKHKLKIKDIQISETNILLIDEKNNLKVYSQNKEKYLLIRDYLLKNSLTDDIISISIYKYFISAINEKDLFLMKISSPEIKKINHNLKINNNSKIKYFNEFILIKTDKNIYIFNEIKNTFENLFNLKSILGDKIISFSISENSIVLLTNKYIFLNEKVIEFSGGIKCKLFNNQLFVSTLNSLIVFNLNLIQLFIYKKINGFKFQVNFDTEKIELKKLISFFKFCESLNKENIIEIENKIINEIINKENSLINNNIFIKISGLLIFYEYKIFFNKNNLNKKKDIEKTSLFYKETPNELIELNSNFLKYEKQDFLIKRFKYSEAFNYLIELNNINLIIKYLNEFKTKNVLKFIFKNKENRIKVINFFISNKNYLRDSSLFIYILDFLITFYQIEYKNNELKNILNSLFEINKDSCLLFGYLDKLF